MSNILIIGAKGFAKELLETVSQNDPHTEVTFFDDLSGDLPTLLFDRYPILRSRSEAAEYFRTVDRDFALGVGSPELRLRFFKEFMDLGGTPRTILSTFAKIGRHANRVGRGTCILTDAIVETNNSIGEGCLIHVGALISHDVIVGDFCEVSPRANILGSVTIGSGCRIGTASTVLPHLTIGDNAVVGAGAVVTKDVGVGQTVVGIPARPIL